MLGLKSNTTVTIPSSCVGVCVCVYKPPSPFHSTSTILFQQLEKGTARSIQTMTRILFTMRLSALHFSPQLGCHPICRTFCRINPTLNCFLCLLIQCFGFNHFNLVEIQSASRATPTDVISAFHPMRSKFFVEAL
mmetsp:Transcript_35772/g.58474  ORF Transcript_35772/g.58474 Transcript_35772/m.58474 type:complete len:135 (-) Transcript_35772:308-712(-)